MHFCARYSCEYILQCASPSFLLSIPFFLSTFVSRFLLPRTFRRSRVRAISRDIRARECNDYLQSVSWSLSSRFQPSTVSTTSTIITAIATTSREKDEKNRCDTETKNDWKKYFENLRVSTKMLQRSPGIDEEKLGTSNSRVSHRIAPIVNFRTYV